MAVAVEGPVHPPTRVMVKSRRDDPRTAPSATPRLPAARSSALLL
ncbi:MAG: hypothetical protein ACP5C4_05895 [Methanomicrobiales archaeon]